MKSNPPVDMSGRDPRLGAAPRYHPYAKGRYEVGAGLYRLETDFGHAGVDRQVFQLDERWPQYRRAKLAARAQDLDRYRCIAGLGAAARRALVELCLQRLSIEHPRWFEREHRGGVRILHCRLSGETLHVDESGELLEVEGGQDLHPPYACALDALAAQVQEDFAVVEVDAGGDRLSALHLCFPNHWAAREKIGRDFAAVHAPVPGMARLNRQAPALTSTLASRGPFVRFAWGLATDTRLNHHPEPPPGEDAGPWRGRRFDPIAPALFVRVERQVCHALQPAQAFFFGIRTYFYDVQTLEQPHRAALARAVTAMDEAALRYKGLYESRDAILDYLRR